MPGNRRLRRGLFMLSLVIGSLFVIWPIFIMTLEAFDIDLSSLFSGFTLIGGIPFYTGGIHPTLRNLIDAFAIDAYPRLVANTLTIDLLSITLAMAAGIPAGYYLARNRGGLSSLTELLVIALRTVSPFAIVIPLYLVYTKNGLWNTYLGLGLAYLALGLPVAVLLIRGFFSDIPREVYEAAQVSGATESQIFRRVALPAAAAGLAATALFIFVLLWNEFILADLLTGGATKTVSVGIWSGAGENIGGFGTIEWDTTNMLGLLSFIPAYAMILALRRYLARGFSLAAGR